MATSIYRDEPAVIYIGLGNSTASANVAWNEEARYYLRELKQQFDDGEITGEEYTSERDYTTEGMRSVPIHTLAPRLPPGKA